MVRWLRWHCPLDTGFEIRALAVWGRACYLSVTEAPYNTNFHTWMGKKHFCFFQTAETGNRCFAGREWWFVWLGLYHDAPIAIDLSGVVSPQCGIDLYVPSLVFYPRPTEEWFSLSHYEIDQSPPSFNYYLNYQTWAKKRLCFPASRALHLRTTRSSPAIFTFIGPPDRIHTCHVKILTCSNLSKVI